MDDPSHPISPFLSRVAKLVELTQKQNEESNSSLTTKDLPSPSHLADFQRMLKNCDNMLALARSRNVGVRPHIKTHKTIEGALLQLYGSSVGSVTVAQFKATSKLVVSTLGEAKFFAEHGFADILYAAPIVPSKLERIERILKGEDIVPHPRDLRPQHVTSIVTATPSSLGVNIAVLIDSKFGFEVVKTWVKSKGVPLRLWLDIDGGYHRTGMNYEEDSDIDMLLAEISKEVKQEYKDLILLDGLYYHGGNSYGSKTIEEIEKYSAQERDAVKGMQAKCEKHSMTFRTMAVGSTPTCSRPPAILEPINEIHPGNYIFYDSWQALIGSCDWTSNASWVLAQIVSTYTTPDRAAFDAGALALSKDLGASHVRDLKYTASSPSSQSSAQDTASGPMASHPIVSLVAPIEFGLIELHQDVLYISRITQEMGIIEVRKNQVSSGAKAHQLLKPSDRIRIIPNHSCLSAACFPSLFIVHGENVVDEWVTAPRIW